MIYVDQPLHFFRGKMYCHLFADTKEELHTFAAKLGLKRHWFQNDKRLPHYDISPLKRAKAVKLGAKEVDRRFVYAQILKNTSCEELKRREEIARRRATQEVVVFGIPAPSKVRASSGARKRSGVTEGSGSEPGNGAGQQDP